MNQNIFVDHTRMENRHWIVYICRIVRTCLRDIQIGKGKFRTCNSGDFFYRNSTTGTTKGAIEANNGTYCLRKRIEKFPLEFRVNTDLLCPLIICRKTREKKG